MNPTENLVEISSLKTLNVIPIRLKSKGLINYCYLVFDTITRNGLLIDPAMDVASIEKQIEINNIQLKHILLTHHHDDHVNLSNFFTKKYGIKAWMHRKEFEYYNVKIDNLRLFENLDVFELGSYTGRALHTPGHTKGSSCFFIQDFLFTGDTLFNEGCGACEEEGGNAEDMFHSLQIIKREVKPTTLVFAGHSFSKAKQGLRFNQISRNNIYLNINEISKFVNFRNASKGNYVYF